MKGLTSYVTQWSRETTIFITAFLIGAFLFIAVTVYGATVIGSAITGVGTSTPLWGDLVIDQQAAQGRFKGVFVVGDNGTSTPSIFVTQKGVVAMGTTTPSNVLLLPGDLVASSTYVTAFGVNNATSTRGDMIVGSYRFSIFGSNRIGMFGTSSPLLDDGLSLGGEAGTHGDLYVSGGLGVANATSSDGDFVVGNDLYVYVNGRIGVASSSPVSRLSIDGGLGAYFTSSALLGLGTTTPWKSASLGINQSGVNPPFVVGSNGTTTPTIFVTAKGVISFGSTTPSALFLNQGDVVIGRNGSTNDLYVSGGLGVANATTTDGDFIIRAADPIFSFTSNGRLVVGATSTALTAPGAPNKFIFDGGQAVFSSGGTGTTTLSILTEAGADGQNGCIEMSADGLTYAIFINNLRTGVTVAQKSCSSL